MDEDRICPDCKRQKARSLADALKGHCPKWWAVQDPDAAHDCDVRTSDVPTGQIPSAENRLLDCVRLFIREWDVVWIDPDDADHVWTEMYEEAKAIVEAVAADTNEECETASQADTGTKD